MKLCSAGIVHALHLLYYLISLLSITFRFGKVAPFHRIDSLGHYNSLICQHTESHDFLPHNGHSKLQEAIELSVTQQAWNFSLCLTCPFMLQDPPHASGRVLLAFQYVSRLPPWLYRCRFPSFLLWTLQGPFLATKFHLANFQYCTYFLLHLLFQPAISTVYFQDCSFQAFLAIPALEGFGYQQPLNIKTCRKLSQG